MLIFQGFYIAFFNCFSRSEFGKLPIFLPYFQHNDKNLFFNTMTKIIFKKSDRCKSASLVFICQKKKKDFSVSFSYIFFFLIFPVQMIPVTVCGIHST